MADQLTVDEAVERAMRTQNEKIAAIRELARGRQALAEARSEATRKLVELERLNAEQVGAVEREDVRLYGAATKAGWTIDELRKIGFDQPVKARRATRGKRSHTARPNDESS